MIDVCDGKRGYDGVLSGWSVLDVYGEVVFKFLMSLCKSFGSRDVY